MDWSSLLHRILVETGICARVSSWILRNVVNLPDHALKSASVLLTPSIQQGWDCKYRLQSVQRIDRWTIKFSTRYVGERFAAERDRLRPIRPSGEWLWDTQLLRDEDDERDGRQAQISSTNHQHGVRSYALISRRSLSNRSTSLTATQLN